MSMITEFVKRLRKHADTFEKSGLSVDGIVKDYRESADVIEELSAKLQYTEVPTVDIEHDILDKIRAEIEVKIEEEEFARSVFRHEEKDTAKAEQCTGSIMAYNNVIKLVDKYKTESEE